jgi:DNA-binding transcriptional ArsR family regulator
MSTDHEPASPRVHQDQPTRRPRDVDAFVDHFLSTMCEASRRHILELLAQAHSAEQESPPELCATAIARALGLAPSTTSAHLRRLTDTGLITLRREGTTLYYRICNAHLVQAFHDLTAGLHQEHASRRSEPTSEAGS